MESLAQRLPAPQLRVLPFSYLEPSKVAEHVYSTGEGADLLAVVATDSPYISEAIDALAARQIPVVALPSDLSAPNLAGYVTLKSLSRT
jgi:LacI family transcriptional regulator